MLRRTVVLTLLIAALLPAFTLSAYALELEDDELAIIHINVGQGAATLILGPADHEGNRVTVLVDAGSVPQFGRPDAGKIVAEALDRYGVTRLDCFIATHYDADHIGGLATDGVEGWRYGNCFMFGLDGVPGTQGDDDGDGNVNWEPDGEPDLDEFGQGVNHDDVLVDRFVDRGAVDLDLPVSKTYGKYVDVRAALPVETVALDNHQIVDTYEIDLGASGGLEATLTCLVANGLVRGDPDPVDYVNEEDERSLCFWLRFGDFHYLIGGDATGGEGHAKIEEAVGKYILEESITVDVLAVNHHGSETSSSEEFLGYVRPEVAVISVGDDNQYGHPDLDALKRLYKNGEGVQTIYQTERGSTEDDVPDYIEDIRVVVDGDVVVTSDGQTFWMAEEPVANFSATPTTGPAPLTVAFTDLSTGDPTSWLWDFGDSGTSTQQHPSHTYADVDSYTVSLTATNILGSDTEIKENYIAVGAPTTVADFSATPTTGPAPLTVTFTDLSTGDPTSWLWDFGDSGTSTQQHPSHTYADVGTCTVSLTATNIFGSDTEIKTDYVTVRFTDVAEDHWACEEILACVDAGIVSGYGDGCYHGDWAVNRGQMSVFVSRALAGGDEYVPDPTTDPGFTDVDSYHWAYKYICYAVEAEVVQGYPEGDYKPAQTVTRDQMAVYVARSICDPTGEDGLVGYVPSEPRNFPDVLTDHWAYKHVEYCVENGVVQGYDDGYYHPEYVVTRDQMAVYIARAFELPT